MNNVFDGADIISSYSRAQAIADGLLVDVSAMGKEAGFRCPVALTSDAWADCVQWTDEDSRRQVFQDQDGRLWDVLNVCLQTALRLKDMDTFYFVILRVPRGGRGVKPRMTRLKACIGPGDSAEPVVTIMLPDED